MDLELAPHTHLPCWSPFLPLVPLCMWLHVLLQPRWSSTKFIASYHPCAENNSMFSISLRDLSTGHKPFPELQPPHLSELISYQSLLMTVLQPYCCSSSPLHRPSMFSPLGLCTAIPSAGTVLPSNSLTALFSISTQIFLYQRGLPSYIK